MPNESNVGAARRKRSIRRGGRGIAKTAARAQIHAGLQKRTPVGGGRITDLDADRTRTVGILDVAILPRKTHTDSADLAVDAVGAHPTDGNRSEILVVELSWEAHPEIRPTLHTGVGVGTSIDSAVGRKPLTLHAGLIVIASDHVGRAGVQAVVAVDRDRTNPARAA